MSDGYDIEGAVASGLAIREMLHVCVENELEAIAVSTDSIAGALVKFRAIRNRSIVFEVIGPLMGRGFAPLSLCTVSFHYEDRARAFLSSVRQVDSHSSSMNSGRELIEIKVPTRVVAEQARAAFRVPVTADSGLEVKIIHSAHRTSEANAINVSITGVYVGYAPDADPILAVGQEVRVRMTLDGITFETEGIVRRSSHHHYGIFFPDVLQDGEIRPSEDIAQLVRSLERHWIKKQRLVKSSR